MKFKDLVFLAEMDYSQIPDEHSHAVRDALRADDMEEFITVTIKIDPKVAPLPFDSFYGVQQKAKKAGLRAELPFGDRPDTEDPDVYKVMLNGPKQVVADFLHYMLQVPGVSIK